MTTTDRIDFADGSAVQASVVPGYWRALLPGGAVCRVPDLDRPGRSAVALFPAPELAARHLAGLGFADSTPAEAAPCSTV